jgi:NitT/TauT family transport system ATP-binding protein
MDEPFSALDEPTRFEMQDLIVNLWSEIEATIVLVSHSVAEAVYLADRVWLMSGAPGTIVAEFAKTPIPDLEVPAIVAQATPRFAECVREVGEAFHKVLAAPREALRPIYADGKGHDLVIEGLPR